MSYPRTWIEVDLDAVRANASLVLGRLSGGCRLLAVVKANAYGLGATAVARTLLDCGASALGVGDSSEALELRESGITAPIMVLGAVCEREVDAVIHYRIIPTLHSVERVRLFDEAARRANTVLPVNVMVDTGMGRLGVKPESAPSLVATIASSSNLKLVAISTHFPCAHVVGDRMMGEQIERFRSVLAELERMGLRPPIAHAANSAALFADPRSHFEMVRPGAVLYGIDPGNLKSLRVSVHPVVSWFTQVVYLKTLEAGTSVGYGRYFIAKRRMRVATLPLGYADGFNFHLAGKGYVLIGGVRCKVLAITMDYVMVDVTQCSNVRVGQKVVVIGRDGDEEIRVEEMARMIGIPPYNIFTSLGRRVHRMFRDRRQRLPLLPETAHSANERLSA